MQTTPRLGLKKIELTDSPPDITLLNDNWDLIDEEIHNAAQPPGDATITDAMLGSRTPDQAQAPASPGTGTLTQLASWLANRVKAITGKTNWWDAPDITLANANSHINATSAHSATSAATANRMMLRDASGRAKVAAPSAADDIARKDTVDAVQNNLSTHAADYTLNVPYGGQTTNFGNAYSIATPAIAALAAGMAIAVKINADSTGATTLNWNSKGAKSIKKANGQAATGLKAGGIYTLRYDGVNFILQGEGASGNATASDLLLGKTATTDAGEITGTMADYAGQAVDSDNITVNAAGNMWINVPDGHYSALSSVHLYDPDFIAANIKAGVEIFKQLGTYSEAPNDSSIVSRVIAAAQSFDVGDSVYYDASGNIEHLPKNNWDMGHSVEIAHRTSEYTYMEAIALSERTFFVAYGYMNNTFFGQVFVVNPDDSITAGNATTISSPDFSNAIVKKLDTNKGILIHKNYDDDFFWVRAFSVSGTTITLGDWVQLDAAVSGGFSGLGLEVLSSTKAIVAYSVLTSPPVYDFKSMVLNISGVTITTNTAVSISSSVTTGSGVGDISSFCLVETSKFLLVYSVAEGENYSLKGVILSISGSTITKNTESSVVTLSSRPRVMKAVLMDTNKILIWYDSANHYFRVVTISGTTVTFGDQLSNPLTGETVCNWVKKGTNQIYLLGTGSASGQRQSYLKYADISSVITLDSTKNVFIGGWYGLGPSFSSSPGNIKSGICIDGDEMFLALQPRYDGGYLPYQLGQSLRRRNPDGIAKQAGSSGNIDVYDFE